MHSYLDVQSAIINCLVSYKQLKNHIFGLYRIVIEKATYQNLCSCAQFVPGGGGGGGKFAPGANNLHHLESRSKFAPGPNS